MSTARFATAILQKIQQEMYGVDDVIRYCLVALYTDGHILLEGNPGLGKTDLVKTLGAALNLPSGRIQFTPDLMPSDITGTLSPNPENPTGGLQFRRGPIFTSLLLADEINRATPKTQSAMLEGMAERQVTVLDQTHPLGTPFMVLATQNPIDHEGTYELPEAQADRFMFKVSMPIPDNQTLCKIMHKNAGEIYQPTKREPKSQAPDSLGQNLLPQDEDASRQTHGELKEQIKAVQPLPSLQAHILNMFQASNQQFDQLHDLDRRQQEHAKRLVDRLMDYGLGPRAATALMVGSKAWTLLFQPNIDAADGAALAQVVIPILLHRIKVKLGWEDMYSELVGRELHDYTHALPLLIRDFCVTTAPKGSGYQRTVEAELKRILGERVW